MIKEMMRADLPLPILPSTPVAGMPSSDSSYIAHNQQCQTLRKPNQQHCISNSQQRFSQHGMPLHLNAQQPRMTLNQTNTMKSATEPLTNGGHGRPHVPSYSTQSLCVE
jgi:hypothetical protein